MIKYICICYKFKLCLKDVNGFPLCVYLLQRFLYNCCKLTQTSLFATFISLNISSNYTIKLLMPKIHIRR